jgi:uncharacterized membrane protein
MNRLPWIGLAASAALNVFVLGAGVGVLATGARITFTPPAKPKPPNIWMAAEVLPALDRVKFRAMLRERAEAAEPALIEVRAARQQAAALTAEPQFDAKAVAAALERARTEEASARTAFDQGVTAYLATMPQKERAELAFAMIRSGAQGVRQSVAAADASAKAP